MSLTDTHHSPVAVRGLPGPADLAFQLFPILTLIAVFDTVQATYVHGNGTYAAGHLFRFLASKSLYFWYFLLLALVVRTWSERWPFGGLHLLPWMGLHLATLGVSFLLHQTISLVTDGLLWGTEYRDRFLFLLFNNPSVWMELFGYGLLLLVFSVMKYRQHAEEHSLACLRLETEVIQSRFNELTARIRPVFLFRALDGMKKFVSSHDFRSADRLLGVFGEFLRTAVYDRERKEKPLQEELTLVRSYLAVEEMIGSIKPELTVACDETVAGTSIPVFVVPAIIESMIDDAAAAGATSVRLMISGEQRPSGFQLIIASNICAPAEFEEGNRGIGLIRRRMKHLSSEGIMFDAVNEPTGMRATLILATVSEGADIPTRRE